MNTHPYLIPLWNVDDATNDIGVSLTDLNQVQLAVVHPEEKEEGREVLKNWYRVYIVGK